MRVGVLRLEDSCPLGSLYIYRDGGIEPSCQFPRSRFYHILSFLPPPSELLLIVVRAPTRRQNVLDFCVRPCGESSDFLSISHNQLHLEGKSFNRAQRWPSRCQAMKGRRAPQSIRGVPCISPYDALIGPLNH